MKASNVCLHNYTRSSEEVDSPRLRASEFSVKL
jgi:hypothetical protein